MQLEPLIIRAIAIQKAEGLSDTEFAARLKIHKTYWIRVRNGTVGAGGKAVRGLIRAYPKLADTLAHSA